MFSYQLGWEVMPPRPQINPVALPKPQLAIASKAKYESSVILMFMRYNCIDKLDKLAQLRADTFCKVDSIWIKC